MSKPQDPLMGLKCFSIAGRLADQRQRVLGMTDEERRWRAQFLKDQILSPDEPKNVPEYYMETTNFFRRLYKTPLNAVQKFLEPMLGPGWAYVGRQAIGKGIMLMGIVYIAYYYGKYHANDFTRYRTVELNFFPQRMYPDHPDYPNVPTKPPTDYYDLGFYSSVLCQEVVPPKKVEVKVVSVSVSVSEAEIDECLPGYPGGVKPEEDEF